LREHALADDNGINRRQPETTSLNKPHPNRRAPATFSLIPKSPCFQKRLSWSQLGIITYVLCKKSCNCDISRTHSRKHFRSPDRAPHTSSHPENGVAGNNHCAPRASHFRLPLLQICRQAIGSAHLD
jgi:hypothetical protein